MPKCFSDIAADEGLDLKHGLYGTTCTGGQLLLITTATREAVWCLLNVPRRFLWLQTSHRRALSI